MESDGPISSSFRKAGLRVSGEKPKDREKMVLAASAKRKLQKAKIHATAVRQRLYVKGVVSGKPPHQAAADAGYVTSSVGKSAAVQGIFREVMNQAGLTDKKLAATLAEGLEANTVKLAQFNGMFTDERVVPDNPTRTRHLEMALKISGHLKEAAINVDHTVTLDGKGFERMLNRVRQGVFAPEPETLEISASDVTEP